MRIAMIGQKGIPAIFGGVERHVHELSVRLAERGFDVTVYARKWYTQATEEVDYHGVHIRHMPSVNTKHLDTITHTFLSTIDALKSGADVIHYHGVGPALLAWIPRLLRPKTRVIVTFHSIDRKHQKWNLFARTILKFGEWAACRFPHKTIAVSVTISQYIRDVYDCESRQYIPNAVSRAEHVVSTESLRAWNLVPKEYILCAARLIPHKGVHYLIAAWKFMKETAPEFLGEKKLVIAGDGYYTDKYVASLHALASQDSSIVFCGFQSGDALAALFAHALFQIHPSDNEGLPMSVLEGMSYGLPVVLSDILEHRELVRNREYLFRRGDAQALAEIITRVLKKDPRDLDKQGNTNRALVEKEYAWPRVVDETVAIYRSDVSVPELPMQALLQL